MKKHLPKIFLVAFLVLISAQKQAFALDCVSEDPDYPAPLPSQIFCPLVKVVNFGLVFVGVVLIIMIILGAIKTLRLWLRPKSMNLSS